MAMGLYDPHSPIRIKVFSTEKGEHFDKEFIERKFQQAYAKRKKLQKDTDAYRIIFGENDGLSGLICDRYKNIIVLKLYSAIWIPYLEWIKTCIIEVCNAEVIILRLSRLLTKIPDVAISEGQILHGQLEDPEVIITEYGVRFKVNVLKGHKTGFFLDHRSNRYEIQKMAKGKTVLDVFAYAGGFSVHALVGGALSATSLDISKQALELASENALLNKHSGKHHNLSGDAFTQLVMLIQQKKKYDLIIIDPPAFAKSSKEIDQALSQYRRLFKLGAQLVTNGGILLLASCSSRITSDAFYKAIEDTFRSIPISYECLKKTQHDIDHPIGFAEGAYLKSGYYRVE